MSTFDLDSYSQDTTCPFAQYGDRVERPSFDDTSDRTTTSATDSSSTLLRSASSSSSCPVFVQEIDPVLLKNSLDDRVAYLTDFVNFTSRDSDIITSIAPHVNAAIPSMVDELYSKLFEFDITKKVFMTRNHGFDGPLPEKLEDLTLDSAQIVFRKVFMKAWARRVLTADYSKGKTWAYMDKVGIMHTGVSPFKHQRALGIAPLNVPYRDCALLLSVVQNVLQTAILRLPEETASMQTKIDAVSAINKVIWIQNDLFARHYTNE
ncbi:Protoglobin-domain-containing protein [Fomitopsis serialis]|uniref:Protoglobin-domain-containing protein n=1 Tax=Fomitopsis serialis TaxID=139415 RepID=UPI0020088388|nr:Protoglobin-domain-containing protein [Neoantrodia serialis]KAH9938352.1 Protoglobin-domain-containing protein [Neoantrodia serialis]